MPQDFENLINSIQRLPGIGPKAATRIALHLITDNRELSSQLINTLNLAIGNIKSCKLCGNLSDNSLICYICKDEKRDRGQIAIVFSIPDIIAIDKSQAYQGLYFVFKNGINIFENKSDFDLEVNKLFEFFNHFVTPEHKEIIFAFPHTIDSEIISSLISEKIKEKYKEMEISRIAFGMPNGADFDYTDKLTIMKSFKGRNSIF